METKCKQCGHDLDHHYIRPDGKVWRFWSKNKFGKKKMACACRECEEWDAMYG